jgi:hypothetical protein
MPTWRGTINSNWGNASNWLTDGSGSGVPDATKDATFDALSPACTITSGAICRNLICVGYANTITFTNTLTVNMDATGGDITFSAAIGFSLVGPNGITYNNATLTPVTKTLTTNGYNFGLPFTTSGVSVGNTLNLVGNFQVSDYVGAVGGFNFTGSELRVSGNWSGSAQGSSLKVLNGTGTMITGTSVQFLVINAPTFTRTFTGSITVSSTLKWTAGTVVSAGSTFSLINATSVDFGGQTLNNATFINSVAQTLVIPTDWYLTGNLQLGNGGIACNGPGKIFVAGNLSNNGTQGGTCVIEMNGTGSITGTYGNHIIVNTAGIITVGISSFISVSTFTLTAGTLNLANELQLNSGTLTITSGIVLSGSSNLRITANTASITSNGIAWPTQVILAHTINVSTIITLNDPLTCLSFISSSTAASSVDLNGSNLNIRGNLTVTKTLGGTTNIFMIGTANSNWTGTGTLGTNLTVNKTVGSGAIVNATNVFWGGTGKTLLVPVNQTFLLFGQLTLGGGTFDCSAGTFTPGLETVTIGVATTSINMGATNTFYNLSFANTGSIITMLSNIVITNHILAFGFNNANGAFDITVGGNATGGTITNTTSGRKITITATSTGTATLTTFSINNFIFEIACSNRNIILTGNSIYTACTINYLATNSGGFTTTGHTLSYFTTSINMFGSTNSWNIISANTSSTLTLLSDVYCVQFGPTLSDTINGSGFFICTETTGALSTLLGNAGLRFVKGSNGTWNQINTNSLARIEFAKTGAGIVNIPNSFTKNGGVIKWVSGAVTHSSTMTLNTSTTMDTTSSVTWNNITVAAGATITISSLLLIGTLAITSGTTTFNGTSGWNCVNLTCSVAGSIITLQNSLTYTTTTSVNMTATNASRILMTSNDATLRAIWTLNQGASQSMTYVNGTRIDSSQGQSVWSFGGTLTSTLNWNIGSRPAAFGYIIFR